MRGVKLLVLVLGLSFGCLGGCAQQNSVLETDSGSPTGQTSIGTGSLPTYKVHIGGCVRLRFRAQLGTCDYGVMYDESSGTYVDCGADLKGQFEWTYCLPESASTDQPIRLTITGYTQRGGRDQMAVGGEMVKAERPGDDLDLQIAKATVLIQAYQSVVDIPVTMRKGPPDWALTKLTITRSDGQTTRVGRRIAEERGFEVTGPDEMGGWHVRFEPKASEINRGGETSAVLNVADEEGRVTVFQKTFATP